MSKVWGHIQSASYLTGIVSVIIGAIIARDLTEFQFTILIVAGIFFALCKLITLCFLTEPKHHIDYTVQSPLFHIKEGIKIIRKNPLLLILFMNETLVFVPLHIFQKIEQPYLIDNGLPVILLGAVYALSNLISFFLSRKIEFLKSFLNPLKIIYISGFLILIAYISAIFFHNVYVAVAVFFIIRLGNVVRVPIFAQIKNDYIPSGSRATTLSLLSVIDSFFDIIIFASFIFIADMGLPIIFAVSAGIVFLGLLFPVKEKVHGKVV